jgi:hypothetical protein
MRYGICDVRYEMFDMRYRIPDARCGMRDTGFRMPDLWITNFILDYSVLDIGTSF